MPFPACSSYSRNGHHKNFLFLTFEKETASFTYELHLHVPLNHKNYIPITLLKRTCFKPYEESNLLIEDE